MIAFGLVDCNSFYVSAERIFRPDLRTVPCACLSNSDGVLIAMSKELKDLGVPPFSPYFKVKKVLDENNATVFSSNYALYGDISNRVVQVIREFAADIEIYSIDEVFIKPVTLFGDYKTYGHAIKKAVWRQVRIPVGVGFASTKTLAKLANRAAKKIKKLDHVCVLEREDQRKWLLKNVSVKDIWGVGSRISARLNKQGIISGLDLANANPKNIRRDFSVCLERTINELNGVSCLDLDDIPTTKKQIYCTRSFGAKTFELDPILQATSMYATRAAEKLRKQDMLVKTMLVFLQSSPYDNMPYYESVTVQLPYPTDDTRILVQYARHAVEKLFKPGYAFSKSGVGLIEIGDKKFYQNDLFCEGQSERTDKLMRLIDTVNSKYGRSTVFTAAEGTKKEWAMKQDFKSPCYTTRWSDLPVAFCK